MRHEREGSVPPGGPRSDAEATDGPDGLDGLLDRYETGKQEEARTLVQRALALEQARTEGAELFREYVLPHVREVVPRLRQAGHKVVFHELLDGYPPSVRLHLYPRSGAMDMEARERWTLELTWGDPRPGRMVAQRWTSAGLGDMEELGSVTGAELDRLWVREVVLTFVRRALDLT